MKELFLPKVCRNKSYSAIFIKQTVLYILKYRVIYILKYSVLHINKNINLTHQE